MIIEIGLLTIWAIKEVIIGIILHHEAGGGQGREVTEIEDEEGGQIAIIEGHLEVGGNLGMREGV